MKNMTVDHKHFEKFSVGTLDDMCLCMYGYVHHCKACVYIIRNAYEESDMIIGTASRKWCFVVSLSRSDMTPRSLNINSNNTNTEAITNDHVTNIGLS